MGADRRPPSLGAVRGFATSFRPVPPDRAGGQKPNSNVQVQRRPPRLATPASAPATPQSSTRPQPGAAGTAPQCHPVGPCGPAGGQLPTATARRLGGAVWCLCRSPGASAPRAKSGPTHLHSPFGPVSTGSSVLAKGPGLRPADASAPPIVGSAELSSWRWPWRGWEAEPRTRRGCPSALSFAASRARRHGS